MESVVSKKRSGLLAALLSLVVPGLGFLYAGKWKLAIPSIFAVVLIVGIFSWTRLILYPASILFAVALIVLVALFIIIASYFVARKNSPCQIKSYQKWYVYLIFFLIHVGINQVILNYRPMIFGFETFRFPSASMLNTLQKNEFLVANTWAYIGEDPEYGDLIVFKYPRNEKIKYIKRLIAKGGDKVSIISGIVHLNSMPVEEPYIDKSNNIRTTENNFGEVTVPEGQYFVLGDNRDRSNDSRYWGFVTQDQLHGRAEYVWMSLDDKSELRMERIGAEL